MSVRSTPITQVRSLSVDQSPDGLGVPGSAVGSGDACVGEVLCDFSQGETGNSEALDHLGNIFSYSTAVYPGELPIMVTWVGLLALPC